MLRVAALVASLALACVAAPQAAVGVPVALHTCHMQHKGFCAASNLLADGIGVVMFGAVGSTPVKTDYMLDGIKYKTGQQNEIYLSPSDKFLDTMKSGPSAVALMTQLTADYELVVNFYSEYTEFDPFGKCGGVATLDDGTSLTSLQPYTILGTTALMEGATVTLGYGTVLDYVYFGPAGAFAACQAAAEKATGSVVGDPQFTGFLGQSYQVHGVSGAVYSILSAPGLQYNALFSYREQGACRAGTQCFSHPGNYFGSVALVLAGGEQGQQQLVIESGAVDIGLNATLNGAPLRVGEVVEIAASAATIELVSAFEVQVRTALFELRVQNSDHFLNQDVAVATGLQQQIAQYKQLAASSGNATAADATTAMLATMPHGILGQTWRKAQYDNRFRYIEGSLFDYELADGLLGTQSKYSRFSA